MREILFRGQVYNGEWVYGLPRFAKYFPEVEISAIEDENGNVYEDVNPETIYQFTGLLDKNGNKIFEGDIIQTEYDKGSIHWDVQYLEYFIQYELDSEWFYLGFAESIEIIGNIHENESI